MSVKRALFVGDPQMLPPCLSKPFSRWRVRIRFADSHAQASELVKRSRFRMVLTKLRLPDANATDLIALAKGRPIDLFSYLRVKEGFLWLPLVMSGQECQGARPLQTEEFLRVAEESLNEANLTSLGNAAPCAPGP